MSVIQTLASLGEGGVRQNEVYPSVARWGPMPVGPIEGPVWDFGETASLGVIDTYYTQTLKTEMVVPARSIREASLGIVSRSARYAHMKVDVFQPDGTSVPPGQLNTILSRVLVQIRGTSTGPIYRFQGQPSLGIVFYADLAGGSSLSVLVDNSDSLSLVDGQTLSFQLFINSDPQYAITRDRVGT